jgi:hypothetical protein
MKHATYSMALVAASAGSRMKEPGSSTGSSNLACGEGTTSVVIFGDLQEQRTGA